jgi:REP element-mobilizing transposase RayT
MPRKSRFYLPHIPAHVMQRGQNRDPVFFEAQDSLEYLTIVQRVAEACHCAIPASVLMTKHIHRRLTPEAGDAISRRLQACGRQDVGAIKHIYRRRGTLWEGRHKGIIVASGARGSCGTARRRSLVELCCQRLRGGQLHPQPARGVWAPETDAAAAAGSIARLRRCRVLG